MNTIKIKDKTWHYWCATSFGGFNYRSNKDICTYSRAVLWGGLMAILIGCLCIALFFGAVILPINTLCDAVFGWGFGNEKLIEAGGIVFFVEVLAGIIMTFCFFNEKRKEKKRERDYAIEEGLIPRPPPPPPSFISEWYKSWKGKYCAKVEIVS